MKKAQKRTQRGRSCLYRWLRQRMRHSVKPGLATMSPKVKLLPDCILQMCLMWLHCVVGAFFFYIFCRTIFQDYWKVPFC